MNAPNDFVRMMYQSRTCLQCGKVFKAFEGFYSEHDGVVACSWECVLEWCDQNSEVEPQEAQGAPNFNRLIERMG